MPPVFAHTAAVAAAAAMAAVAAVSGVPGASTAVAAPAFTAVAPDAAGSGTATALVDLPDATVAPLADEGFVVASGDAWHVDGAVVSDAASALALVDRSPIGYDRDLFEHWTDPDGNGCDARNDVLARDLTDIVLRDDCLVETGALADPYTGASIAFERGQATSSLVQIDHVVPLAAAWTGGAATWTGAQREAFANDPANLQATDGPTNTSKGAALAGEWLPPNTDHHCGYVARMVLVLAEYDLAVTALDRETMVEVAASCQAPADAAPPTGIETPAPSDTADASADDDTALSRGGDGDAGLAPGVFIGAGALVTVALGVFVFGFVRRRRRRRAASGYWRP